MCPMDGLHPVQGSGENIRPIKQTWVEHARCLYEPAQLQVTAVSYLCIPWNRAYD